MHILLVEDDLDLGRALLLALKAEDISARWIRRVADAPFLFEDEPVDCVLLDLTLPDADGLALLAGWRRRQVSVPVIIMTARSSLEERLAGLDMGADDFLVKPFAPAELVSRIRAVCRRSVQQASDKWVFGELTIEPKQRTARLSDAVLELSPREYQLLLELARVAGTVIPKGTLAQRLAPLGDPLEFGAIEVHVSNLRRKLGGERIRTVRGVGYMLVL